MLVDHFLENAIELDVDALCDSEDVIIAWICTSIVEEAGIPLRRLLLRAACRGHSCGDA